MIDTEYFEGRSAEDRQPRTWKEIAWEIFCTACWGAFIGCVLATLPGCAMTKEGPRVEVCRFQLLGQTSDGMPVVATTCVSPEAFAESQK